MKKILEPMRFIPQFVDGLRGEFTIDGRKSCESWDIGCLDAPEYMPAGSTQRYEIRSYAWAVLSECRRGS